MKQPLIYPSYIDIQRGCLVIAKAFLFSQQLLNSKLIAIVGLSRGGLIPGVELSYLLNVPFVPVSYSSIRGNGNDRNHDNILPEIKLPTIEQASAILIVDDICDSGHTLDEVYSHYYKQYPAMRILTAVLYYKQGAIHNPNYYWQYLNKNDPWIKFPWEV